MSISLYELTAEYRQALDNITVDDNTGEVFGMEALEAIDSTFDAKAVNCALYAKSLAAEAAAIKTEEQTLAVRRKTAERKLDRLKEYIAGCMDAAGKDIIQDPRVRLSFRASKQVIVDSVDELPDEYVKVVTERKPDKTAIKVAIESGNYLVGARLVTRQNLQIK